MTVCLLPLQLIAAHETVRAEDSVLPGRPDAAVPAGGDQLGTPFMSLAAGISIRPPAGMTLVKRVVGEDEIVQYTDEKRQWLFKVSRIMLGKPSPLESWSEMIPDPKNDLGPKIKLTHQGMLESAAQQFQMDMGTAEILRQDVVNIADLPVGRIAARYNSGPDTARLTQRALIQAGEQLYYSVEFTSPAPREGEVSLDPKVKAAVDTFSQVLDSVKLLDQRQIMQDHDERLFRTRALLVNLTEEKFRAALRPEQWLLITRDGKPLGYTYAVERVASDIPRTGQGLNLPKGNADGVLIGVRSRTIPQTDQQLDAETWQWMSFDRKHEVWSNLAIILTPDPVDKTKQRKERIGEFGSSDATMERIRDRGLEPGEKRADGSTDEKQPQVRQQEIYTLNVTPINRSGENQAVTRQLPPYYIPQAMGTLLPRLVAKNEGKTYLVAAYVSDRHEVLKRYIDVGTEKQVTLGDRTFRAVPVNDRIGLEGALTTHYISPKGDYLGSESKESGIIVIASDGPTIERLFAKPDLTLPGEVTGQPADALVK